MFKATGLNNIEVGGKWNNILSLRFQAISDVLAAIRLYWIIANPPGKIYMAGNGGSFSYGLYADDNGKPAFPATRVRNALTIDQITESKRGNFPLICFPPTRLLVGAYYHVVVQNTDPKPQENFSSLDFLFNPGLVNQTPDLQVLVAAQGLQWGPADKGIFIGSPVALFYSDGKVQGYGYIAAGAQYPNGLEPGDNYGFPKSICL